MYKNKVNKFLNNTQTVYSSFDANRVNNCDEMKGGSDNREIRYSNVSVDKKIDDIFNASDYIYKADVNIVTDNEILNKRIVARNRNNLITIEGEYIPISMIRDIYK